MSIFKCKMCGGDLDVQGNITVVQCDYCGTKQTVPSADNEKKMMMFERANKLRYQCEFDKAAGMYESIITDFPYEAEAYWGLILCKYGIEYVNDPVTGKKIPTCHRSSFDSVLENDDFEKVLEYSDSIAVSVYRDEAKRIETLRRNILEISNKEKPYDIFICYKETDDSGNRTIDSVIAQNIYSALINEGYRVFFSRITLEDKLGMAYEPYIFAALNSAKVMLVVGTSYENYTAVWVKNEWNRFLTLIAKGENKVLVPCYKDIEAYDMPNEFRHLQAQDMGKVGAIQDLIRGIEKLFSIKQNTASRLIAKANASPYNRTESLLKRAFLFVKDKEFSKADKYFESVLDTNPENGDAYIGKMLCEYKLQDMEDIKKLIVDIRENKNYKKILSFGSRKEKSFIISAAQNCSYNYGLELQRKDTVESLQIAIDNFRFANEINDANERITQCQERIRYHQEAERANALRQQELEKANARRQQLQAQKRQLMNSRSSLGLNREKIKSYLKVIGGIAVFDLIVSLLGLGLSNFNIFGVKLFLGSGISNIAIVIYSITGIIASVLIILIIVELQKGRSAKSRNKSIDEQIQAIDAELDKLPR